MSDVLFHYTSKYHLAKILKTGYLKLTESNLLKPVSYADALPKPDSQLHKPVVWLTRTETPVGNGLEGCLFNKYEIRLTFHKRENYIPWLVWSRNNRINKSWAKMLERGNNPNAWYVSEQIVPLNAGELVWIENTVTGETIIDIAAGVKACEIKIEKPDSISSKHIAAIDNFLKDAGLNLNDTVSFAA